MSKVSIGLRGWRFDESAVFADDGSFLPFSAMPAETRTRLSRLTALVNRPCHACWLGYGDAEIERCNPARAVYGEPMAEVLLCDDHEPDFVYWFREEGGSNYRGTDDLADAFHGWFTEGNRAPEGYGGITHVETDPDALPDPEAVPEASNADAATNADTVNATNTANADATNADAATNTANTANAENDTETDTHSDDGTGADDSGGFDLDLSREYPK